MSTPKNPDKFDLGKAIAEVRIKQKLTLREVARKAKLSHQAVFRVERGLSGLDTAAKVMRVLGMGEAKVAQLVRQQVQHMVGAAA